MFFTALASKEVVQRCMDVGMVGYIVKPYKPEELLERLEKFFETSTYVPPENGNGASEEQDEQ